MSVDDEYDPPEPRTRVVVADRSKIREALDEQWPSRSGYAEVVDGEGKSIMVISIPSRRMRMFTPAEAIYTDIGDILEDVAVAFRNQITREEFLTAVNGVLHILKQ